MATPNDLKYFLETTKTLNLTKAAEKLGINQPSLSTAIKRLESHVGVSLLVRHKRGVSLTQAGKQLLVHTKQLLQYWDDVKETTISSHRDVQGNITLGCHPSIGLFYLSKFLPELLIKHPKLQVQLKHDFSRKITDSVINVEIDVGIVANPIKHNDLIIRKIRNDEVKFWMRQTKNPPTFSKDETILICNPELTQTQNLLQRIKRQKIQFKRMVTSDNLEILANLTANSNCIGILPGSVAMANHAKVLRPVPQLPIYLDEICLIYRQENRDVKAIQALVNAIKATSLI